MRIGNLDIQGHVVLGPMAGISVLPYREFMKEFGAGLVYTEMVSDCGLVYKNKRTYEYLETSPKEAPVGIQLFGFDKEKTVKAITICEEKATYDVLDINLGCPVNKVVKTGAGSAWLRDLDGLKEYMSAVVSASHKPVTAKIRLGWDNNSINVFETVDILQQAGVAAVTVHCRTRSQGYSGKADYSAIAGLKEKMGIPLIVSGDIFSPEKAKEAIEITHADAVMVARGGVGHPALINQINTYLEDGIRLEDPDLATQVGYAEMLSNRMISYLGEEKAINLLKHILPSFFSNFPGYKKVRSYSATQMKTSKDLFEGLNLLKENL